MNTREFIFALTGLLVMGLPVLAGGYYYSRVAPRIDILAIDEENLPRDCEKLDQQLHQAFMHNQSSEMFKTARKDREKGVRLCAEGAETKGVLMLKTALRDLGLKPVT